MTAPVDTSDEAVRREIDLLCARLAGHGGGDTAWSAWAERTIALIKALAAERDALRASLDEATGNWLWVQWNQAQGALLKAITERDALRAAWLRVIQRENSCAATGHSCVVSKRCGCVEEQRMLIEERTP